MSQTDLRQLFLESASEVFETMFFTAIENDEAGDYPGSDVSAELDFNGIHSGKFGVQVPLATGRQIAANFLGIEEVSEAQVDEVLCELCNMLCGSVLSRLDADARFELRHPEVDPGNLGWHQRMDAVGYTFRLDEGAVTMWIAVREPHVITPAA